MSQPTQEEVMGHINEILNEVSKQLPDKYIKGQEEHGGRLWEKNVGQEIYPELIDFIVYFHTYKKQVDALVATSDEVNAFIIRLLAEGQMPKSGTTPTFPPEYIVLLQESLRSVLDPFHYKMQPGDN